MQLIDRLLGHDAWTTNRLLELAADLSDAQLDKAFDIGHQTVRATLEHVIWNIECWTDLMLKRSVRVRDPGPHSVARLSGRHGQVSDELARFAMKVVREGRLNETYVDVLDDPLVEKSLGGTLVHLATHGMHHRAQLLFMMRRLGVSDLPEGDALTWELSHTEREKAATPTSERNNADIAPADQAATDSVAADQSPLPRSGDRVRVRGQTTIRHARDEDVPAITQIYNEAIRTTVATFDTEEKSEQNRREWLNARDERHPVLVAVADDTVVGWAALTQWSDRCAYSNTAETSFYVLSTYRGRGIGRALKIRLVEEARARGFHTLLSRAAEGSDASLHLNHAAGFQHIGTMREVGRKFGRLLDVHMMQLMLGPPAAVDRESADESAP